MINSDTLSGFSTAELSNTSLRTPASVGPKPWPMMADTNNTNADEVALCRASVNDCIAAKLGPSPAVDATPQKKQAINESCRLGLLIVRH